MLVTVASEMVVEFGWAAKEENGRRGLLNHDLE